MEFRPCIDIHNGKVKQIVGSSLRDAGDAAKENFVAGLSAQDYAEMFKKDALKGGHVILLNPSTSPWYEETRRQVLEALAAYPGGLQVGGGIRDDNAMEFVRAGASHVIVTSYVFFGGSICMENLLKIVRAVGPDRLVLDLSCRKKEDGKYYICTDRWQKFTDTEVTPELFMKLSAYCSEFLVHGIDVEGKGSGFDGELVEMLGRASEIPVTYAGGIRSLDDLFRLRQIGRNRVHATVGSALDIYGGSLPYADVVRFCRGMSQFTPHGSPLSS
ncbi:MAG: phosphoribosylformimino-5-aminoimidazole carboxamide ribotide isomerase [Lachnospiraceae bacterium]|nr:phosphoribosylformimino-5-aminoimidazole carboxamide ribotide isomerase [Lachnospiraceae bacterium]